MKNVYFVGFFSPGMQTCHKNKSFLDCLEYQSSLTFVQEQSEKGETLLRVKHLWNNVFRQKKRPFCLLLIEWGVSFSSRATKERISHAVHACQIVTTPHSTTHWLTASRSVTYFVWSRFPVVVQKSYFRPIETSSCLSGCALISVFQDSGYWLPITQCAAVRCLFKGKNLPLFVDLIRDICTVQSTIENGLF